MNPFPAVVIGGPPHSGKSVLTYLLTRQLRALRVEHYVLRLPRRRRRLEPGNAA